MQIPFINLSREAEYFLPELLETTQRVLQSGMYINGPNVQTLEKNLCEYLQVKYVISVGNGSDALTFILKSLDIHPDDEIICPANSFIATSWSIVAAGAKPVFCDVGDDLLLDINDFKRKVTPKTKALIPVHLTGRVFDTDEISDFCKDQNIAIVEDAAQSFGAKNKDGRKTGSLGKAGAFSLHPLKNFAIYGDGGIITTNSPEIAKKCILLRNHGLKNRDEASIWGFNSRLDELQASYALVKLPHIENLTKRYIEIAKYYDEHLINDIKKPTIRRTYRDVYHNYVVLVSPRIRDLLMKNLLDFGIETKIHYPIPLHLQECAYKLNYQIGDLPKAESFAKSMISLPIYPELKDEELFYIVDKLNNLHGKFK